MKKWLMAIMGLSVLAACASGLRTQPAGPDITFETEKSRRVVMDVIVDVGTEDGYRVGSVSQKEGRIVFKPRKMLNGALVRKIDDSRWNIQTKASTLNHMIQFSAHVSREGVVTLRTLVMASGLTSAVDEEKSEKLAEYYKASILRILRTPKPKLL